jgi:formate hydrogenlyase subunit 3/multisubunit Na+/H+ antiporter MnhD subunit
MTLHGALLLLALGTPLAAALLVPIVRKPLGILPWAAVPGLAAALLLPSGTQAEAPALLIGLTFRLDVLGGTLLGVGALLWVLAGLYAGSYLAGSARARSFAVFWLLTMTGTLGTFIADDVVAFYLAFSMMSLASYGLVIHDRTPQAQRAGRIYIVLAVLGETALVAAFMLAATHAASLQFDDVRAALTVSPWAPWALAGIVVGLGIKAGLAPLHVWLPLAHPEAPTPASAVLSGIIVKAGIIGLLRLLPGADGGLAWGDLLIVLGLVTAFYGIAAGLPQKDPKVILAYSTLSQMGLVVTVLGSAYGAPSDGEASGAAVLYAAHHGLAKGALFLAVGVAATTRPPWRAPVVSVTALTALAIAGLPFSGGSLAKLAIKAPLGDGSAGTLASVSAVGTALLMLRFLAELPRPERGSARSRPPSQLAAAWAVTVLAAFTIPWWLNGPLTGHPAGNALHPAALWGALWPILTAAAVAWTARRFWRGAVPVLPPGDWVVIAEALVGRTRRRARTVADSAHVPALLRREWIPGTALALIDRAEAALREWRVSGAVIVLLVIAIAWSLRVAGG